MSSTRFVKNFFAKRIRRPLGIVRRWLRSRPWITLKQRERMLRDTTLKTSDRELLELVDTRISRHDGMYIGKGAHYYRVGLSAVECIEEALVAAGINSPTNVLDLPCGHGRVLRFLVHRFPQARFVACDLDRDGVEFCAEVLGAEAAYSEPDLSRLALGREFDLIWCGSLVTHLDAGKIPPLIEFFSRHLAIGGLVIFTAPGDLVMEAMASRQFDYGIDRKQIPKVVNSYRETGFGYTDYPYMGEYGVSLTSPDWIRNQVKRVVGLREVYFQPHGWDNHQDVYGFIRER